MSGFHTDILVLGVDEGGGGNGLSVLEQSHPEGLTLGGPPK